MPESSPRSASVDRVRVRRRLDTESAVAYRDRIRSVLKSGRAVVIHFPAGAFVDVQGLWTLVGLADLGRDLQESESVAVASASREVTQLIDLTRLDRYLPVFKNPDAAATWLQARRMLLQENADEEGRDEEGRRNYRLRERGLTIHNG